MISPFVFFSAAVSIGSDMMPGQIPDPSVTAGSLPSLGHLAGIPATTLTDQLKFGDLRELGAMLSPLHFLGKLGKRPITIKTEVRDWERVGVVVHLIRRHVILQRVPLCLFHP